MKGNYTFQFYKEEYFEQLEELVLNAYEWDYPAVGLSRFEFCHGLHPAFNDMRRVWECSVGMYFEGDHLVGCVWNEGACEGDAYFLFDSKERAEEMDLLHEMINFARMYGANITDEQKREINIYIPEWNHTLMEIGKEMGLTKTGWPERCLIRPFTKEKIEAKLPEGYSFIDGNTSPDFFLANVHRMSFGYKLGDCAARHGEEAFHELRTMKHYDKDLDLCVIDPLGRPVAMAMIWYDPKMPYCELEPLGVVWWERRKGIATAILQEAGNRVMEKYPDCQGMLGGDQEFYRQIGYVQKTEVWPYHWEKKVIISWFPESKEEDYKSVMKWDS